MPQIKPEDLPHYVYEDYERWEGRWELVYGIPYAMSPSPIFNHQKVSYKIARHLDDLLENCEKCEEVIAVDWIIAEDTVVCPDIMVICDKVEGKYPTKPPVMIFEILSPSTSRKDRNLKYELYESQGVKYYIIVDLDNTQADIYELKDHYEKTIQAYNNEVHFDLTKCQIDFDFSTIWKP